jgi:protease I
MELEGKKVFILVEDDYNELELWYPYYRLKEARAEVILVGASSGEAYHGKAGIEAVAEVGVQFVSSADFDAVIIPGGYAPDRMRRNREMVRLVKEMFEAGKIVAAICHAGWMLASAGILKGKKITSFHSIRDDMVNAGAEWVDQEVVGDGNLITSRQPDDLPAFMKLVIGAIINRT